MTNKVFSVVLFAYLEGLAASAKASRERPPASPVSWLFSDLMAKSLMPLQTGSSPAQRIWRNRTDDNVNQKETSRAPDTDSCVRLLTHRLVLVLVNRLNNGNSRFNFATQCLNKFQEPVRTVEDVEKQSCEAIGLLTKRHVSQCFATLFCNAVLVSVSSHAFLTVQEKKTHQPKTN